VQQSLGFPSRQGRVYSVSDLSSEVRAVVETDFDDITVEGELSGFKRHRSGHCYFTIKDDSAQLRAVLWRHFAQYVFFQPKDGMVVRLRGQISLYEARGDLQFVARSMQMAGEGALQAAFEALKRKLASEGLFEADRKRELPRLPERIGLVTSGSGAVLHDVLSIIERRFPGVEIVLCDVPVQGYAAATQIARAIDLLNERHAEGSPRLDVLIIGRGGGSIEDLWAFNEEVVARALARSVIPTISAVGHETDFTIADYVADIRAATPSMAAELVVPDGRLVRQGLSEALRRSTECLTSSLERRRRDVAALLNTRAFHRPTDRMKQYAQRIDELSQRLERATSRCMEGRRREIDGFARRLALLDPHRPLHLGYARIERDGAVVTSSRVLEEGNEVRLVFNDGVRGARITD
jgi:exodeoxyribonuclease VII large subunit